MKRRDGFKTGSDSRNESLDNRLFSRFPKFLELSEEEKKTFYGILNGARENVQGRKPVKGKLPSKNVETMERSSEYFRDDTFPNRERFVALSETEKEIYFTTLKRASDNTNRKKKNSRTEPEKDGILNVAVNLISKDNERIRKAQARTKINKKTNRFEKEKMEDEEDRLLLDIIGKRPEKDASTKGIFSEINLAASVSSENNNLKRSLSFIETDRRKTKLSGESTMNQDSTDRGFETLIPARSMETAAEAKIPSPETSIIMETKEAAEEMIDSDKEKVEEKEVTEKTSAKEAEKEKVPTEPPDLTITKLEENFEEAGPTASEPETGSLEKINFLQNQEMEARSVVEQELGTDIISSTTVQKELEDLKYLESTPSLDQENESTKKSLEKTESLESLPSDKDIAAVNGEDSTDFKEKDLPYPLESGRASFAEEEKKSELSLLDSDASKTSGESSEEVDEQECVPIYDKKLTAPKSRVRTLQDLLKDRAVLVVDSSDRFKIEWKPKEEIQRSNVEIKETAFSDLDPYEEEAKKKKKKNKIIFFLEKMFACGRKETEKEDVIAENLKGESVSVEMGSRQRNAASATLDDATIEVLEAAKRKRIIAQYTKQN